MVGKKNLFELKKCTVSGLKRQFDKWHLFSAPTPPPRKPDSKHMKRPDLDDALVCTWRKESGKSTPQSPLMARGSYRIPWGNTHANLKRGIENAIEPEWTQCNNQMQSNQIPVEIDNHLKWRRGLKNQPCGACVRACSLSLSLYLSLSLSRSRSLRVHHVVGFPSWFLLARICTGGQSLIPWLCMWLSTLQDQHSLNCPLLVKTRRVCSLCSTCRGLPHLV